MCNLHKQVSMMVLGLMSSPLMAQSNDPQSSVPAGLVVLPAIAYLSRRRAIGGWLLVFYIQLFVAIPFGLLFIPQTIMELNPNIWDNYLDYAMFFVSAVPITLAWVFEVFAGTKLLLSKNGKNLNLLKLSLAILAGASIISLVIDAAYFSDEIFIAIDSWTLFLSLVWLWYFAKARRVAKVFVEKNWVYQDNSERRKPAAEDK